MSTNELAKELQQRRVLSKVWMSPSEMSLIESYLDTADTMLEWGSGYSTLWYSQFVREYYSIEHDKGWYEEMRSQISTISNVHYLASPVDKGYKGWLGGFDEGTYEQFEDYVKKVDDFKVSKFDKVLIDGRARAVCAEYILKYLHPKSLVFIHDYNPRHPYHQAADLFYTKVAEVYENQSVVVLRPKEEALAKAASGGTLRTEFTRSTS